MFGLNPKATGSRVFWWVFKQKVADNTTKQCFSNLIITCTLLMEMIFKDFFRVDLNYSYYNMNPIYISFN